MLVWLISVRMYAVVADECLAASVLCTYNNQYVCLVRLAHRHVCTCMLFVLFCNIYLSMFEICTLVVFSYFAIYHSTA